MAAERSRTDRVARVIAFIEKLRIPSGKGAGDFVKLRPFQKDFISDIYGPTRSDGLRLVRRAILSIGRKNGKSFLTAALVLVHLVGPEAELNGEIYSAANDREQAGIIFKYVSQIIQLSPTLRRIIKVIPSTKTMICYRNGSVYRALSAEVGTKYGLNPTVAIYDELAQAKTKDLYDALDTSMAARPEPLFIVISTQSNDPQHVLSQIIDDGLSKRDPSTICHLYAVPDDAGDEIFTDAAIWKLANPALGDFRSLDELKGFAAKAQRLPAFESTFRNLYLNQRVDAKSPLIPRLEWEACKSSDATIHPGEGIYVGLDLSATTDLCAVAIVSGDSDDRVAAKFWKPADLVAEHERRDRVPYSLWVKQGYIIATAGKSILYDSIAAYIAQLYTTYRVLGVAFDRWRMDQMLNAMDRIEISGYIEGRDDPIPDGIRLVPWGQGFASMGPAVDALESSILNRTFKHDGDPVLTWNFANAIAVSDGAGNRKLDKSKVRFRIDGAQAVTMALGLKARDRGAISGPSVYETQGVLCL